MRKKILIAASLGLAAALAATTSASAATIGVPKNHVNFAEISVLHAVPNTPVDVYIDHKKVINNFEPGSFAGPLDVAAGKTYTVTITGATAKNDKSPVIGPVKIKLASKANYTLVAHLTAAGKPTGTLYKNDLSTTPSGTGRLIVRHDAAAPAVDILANGAVAMKSLTNPKESRATLPAATYSAAVALAGTTAPVIGPADVAVKNQKATIVYAWGSAADGTLNVAVQTIAFKGTKNGHHGSSAAGSDSYGTRSFGW